MLRLTTVRSGTVRTVIASLSSLAESELKNRSIRRTSMRSRLAQTLVACALSALSLSHIVALAQPAQTIPAIDNATAVKRSTPIKLQALIEEAIEQNREIKTMQRGFDMMRARIPQARALPEPMLNVGYMGNAVPIPPFDIQKGDPSSGRFFSFSQEIPFPGKLALKGRMANVVAEAEWWNYEQVRLNVIAEVKDAYFDLFYLHKSIETVTRNKDLLGKFAKIAEASYSVGKGIQQDVLKAQVEISKLTDQLITLEQRRQVAEARLNSLLFREPETPVGEPEEIRPQDFTHNLAELTEAAFTNYPALKA